MHKKPIRRNENIVKLSKEHHFSLLFCWKIRQGIKMKIPAARIIKYVEYFKTNFLRPHFKQEETILFAALKDKPVKKAIKQHKEINNLVAKLLKNIDASQIEQLEKLADLVDDHVRYEERQLFPHIEKTLKPAQLEAIGEQLHKHSSLTKDEYEDEFWVKR
ncbi:MAG: hemerythrin domain-containing protein [Ginsengibacter sp.]